MPVINTNQPKIGFNVWLLIFLLKIIPINIPAIEKLVNLSKNNHSIGVLLKLPAKPIKELTAMIINEVATAFFIGNLAENNSVGIIRKPPPTPTKPVNAPIKIPFKTIDLTSILKLSFATSVLFLIIETEAKIIRIAKTTMIKKSLVIVKSRILKSSIGNRLTKNLRITKIEITLGKPKYKAILVSNS